MCINSSGAIIEWEGSGKPCNGSAIPQYDIEFPKFADDKELTLTILGSDYNHYAVLNGCKTAGDLR